MKRLALLGQASARARLSALLLRLSEPLIQREYGGGAPLPMPLTQQEMGNLIGVSAVHVNATMKALRTAGITTVSAGMLHIQDSTALAKEAGVARRRRSDPGWLPKRRGHDFARR
ncbi:helix-turn-helix domain-containing protein [Qipengyuania sediminis]|uniref:helix-turn-helix domain-containing protein n=1 Tax=Qipengyuania sediminis TaxID=1532023 RepID=UPI0010598C27|nr:helix-turn-helix domain-containing protein [Qipengyuania sediminis]